MSKSSLTDVQIDRIFDLAKSRPGKPRMSPAAIARLTGASRNAVAWFMYCNGLKDPARVTGSAPYRRKNGDLVVPYQAAEDSFIVKLRADGLSYRAIAEALNSHFSRSRTPHSVQVRLIMLACFETARDDSKLEAA